MIDKLIPREALAALTLVIAPLGGVAAIESHVVIEPLVGANDVLIPPALPVRRTKVEGANGLLFDDSDPVSLALDYLPRNRAERRAQQFGHTMRTFADGLVNSRGTHQHHGRHILPRATPR